MRAADRDPRAAARSALADGMRVESPPSDHTRTDVMPAGRAMSGNSDVDAPASAHTPGASSPQPSITADAAGWQPLPSRARWLYVISTAIGMALTALAAALVPVAMFLRGHALTVLPAALAAGALIGALYGNRRYLNTGWRHDSDGFALRRGRLWQSDTRVPGSRVQHLDLKRGPLERLCGLATLVVHTAGTRHSSVALSGLDHADAERLRDALSRQTADDDDD